MRYFIATLGMLLLTACTTVPEYREVDRAKYVALAEGCFSPTGDQYSEDYGRRVNWYCGRLNEFSATLPPDVLSYFMTEYSNARFSRAKYSDQPVGSSLITSDGQSNPKLYHPSECIGAVVGDKCHGTVIDTDPARARCYGTVIGGQCTGPVF